MDMEPTTKHSWTDPEAKPASTEQSWDRRTPLGADNQNTQSTFQAPPQAHQQGVAEGPDAPRVEYPQALYATPGYQPAWPYPYAWPPGTMPGTYGADCQVNYSPNYCYTSPHLVQMANMQWMHMEDVSSPNTMMAPLGSISADTSTGQPKQGAAWDATYSGPPLNVTVLPPDEFLCQNIVLEVTLLSPEATDIKMGDGPSMPLHTAQKLWICPFHTQAVQTDIYWEFPTNSCGEIKASGRECFKDKGIVVMMQEIAHIPIDGIRVLLHNSMDTPYTVNVKDVVGEITILWRLCPIIQSHMKVNQSAATEQWPSRSAS